MLFDDERIQTTPKAKNLSNGTGIGKNSKQVENTSIDTADAGNESGNATGVR